jgi:hypothetical protein
MIAARALLVLALAGAACGPKTGESARTPGRESAGDVRVAKDRPPLVVVIRDGDARGAIAWAVSTSGIAPDRGAEVAVALAGAIEARLDAKGIRDATVVSGWDGYRVRVFAGDDAQTASRIDIVRAAMLVPMDSDSLALAGAAKKLTALSKRPLVDPALLDSVRCTGEAFALMKPAPSAPSAVAAVTAHELEAWRRAAHGLGRVTLAAAGSERVAAAATAAIARGDAWPHAAPPVSDAWPSLPAPNERARAEVYDATGTLAAGSARVTLAVRTTTASQAVAAANALGDVRGPLASRLGALDAPARVESVIATAHSGGGCLVVAVDVAARGLATDASGRLATAAALARQEIAASVNEAENDPTMARAIALRAGDPRDAAERAAWWALSALHDSGSSSPFASSTELRFSIAIGLANGRDAAPSDALASRANSIRADLDRAMVAWHSPVVDARSRVERGQGEMWILIGSPCGTASEVDADAGLAAAAAVAAAKHALLRSVHDASVEPWVASDGVGLLVHGPALSGEAPASHARRLADLGARSFAADSLEPTSIAQARASLLFRASTPEGRASSMLGAALAPGHPSWVSPLGTTDGLGRSSDESVWLRMSAIRGGPLRVAVVANADAAQVDAAVRAADRWIARRPGEARTCALSPNAAPASRSGTYAVEVASGGGAEATLALPLPLGDDAFTSASWIAAALDGDGGLLAHALGDGALARSEGVRVIGEPRAPALVLRFTATNAQLDQAVAQVRALIDRLRQGALTDADRARAQTSLARDELSASLDPRARVIALFRSKAPGASEKPGARAPTLDALHAFAAAILHDDALVIIAARPARSAKSP